MSKGIVDPSYGKPYASLSKYLMADTTGKHSVSILSFPKFYLDWNMPTVKLVKQGGH